MIAALHRRFPYKWIALSSTSLAVLLVTVNQGSLIIALPVILRQLHTSLIDVLWIVMVYLLITTVFLIHFGRFGDLWGRKRLFNLGFWIFTAGSLLCGLATSGGLLIFYRVIQGVGGAIIFANSTAIVTDAFPKGERGRALGINSMVAAVGSIAGPILGGALVTFLGWRWAFFFNVPLGVAGALWCQLSLREMGKRDVSVDFDIAGTGLFLLGITALLLALSFGGVAGWTSPAIMGLGGGGLILLALFLRLEQGARNPLLDLHLFRSRVFTMGNLSAFLNSVARMAVMFLLIFYYQGPRGDDPLTAAILLTPLAASLLVVAPISGYLSDLYGSRGLSSLGLALSAVGLAGLALRIGAHTAYGEIVLWLILLGGGSGLFNSPNTAAVMGAVPPEKRGVGAGTRSMLTSAGMVISLALALAFITSAVPMSALMRIFVGQHVVTSSQTLQGFLTGLRRAFWLSAVISGVAVWVSMSRGRTRPQH